MSLRDDLSAHPPMLHRIGWRILCWLVDSDYKLRRMIADRLAWQERRVELAGLHPADQEHYLGLAQGIIDREIRR